MNDIAPRRARSLPEMGALFGKMFDAGEQAAAIASYRPQPGDVIISPYGKSGTTWLQQIFHALRTRGDMDFDDISRVVPWIETASVCGIDLNATQRAAPRGFKSHLPYDQVPKGARYIVPLRDPKDAFVSLYRFMEGWFIEPGAIPIEDFAAMWLMRGGEEGYWHHLVSWWEQRDNPDVLLLSYARMIEDPEDNVRRVAAFCGIPLDDDLLALTLQHASLAFMLAHKDRFDDLMMRQASERRCNLPAGGDSAKVRKGGVGGHRHELPAPTAQAFDAIWAERVAPKLGFADYAALEAALG